MSSQLEENLLKQILESIQDLDNDLQP